MPEPGVSEVEATTLQVELISREAYIAEVTHVGIVCDEKSAKVGRVEASFTLLSLIRSLDFLSRLLTLGRVEASFTLLSLIRSLEFTEFLEKFIVGLVVQEPKVGAAIFNQQMFRVV